MQALTFWKKTVMDSSNFLEELLALFEAKGIHFCVLGGQGVNAYVEPLVSLDLDLAVAADQHQTVEALLASTYKVTRFPYSLNAAKEGSALRVQIQTDPRYAEFVGRSSPRNVLGLTLPVASLSDVLQGKIWAVEAPARRPSKRQKDLADIIRILEAYPDMRRQVPAPILKRLIS